MKFRQMVGNKGEESRGASYAGNYRDYQQEITRKK